MADRELEALAAQASKEFALAKLAVVEPRPEAADSGVVTLKQIEQWFANRGGIAVVARLCDGGVVTVERHILHRVGLRLARTDA
jgi:hypothetical protein